jgi:hypothetical protein
MGIQQVPGPWDRFRDGCGHLAFSDRVGVVGEDVGDVVGAAVEVFGDFEQPKWSPVWPVTTLAESAVTIQTQQGCLPSRWPSTFGARCGFAALATVRWVSPL